MNYGQTGDIKRAQDKAEEDFWKEWEKGFWEEGIWEDDDSDLCDLSDATMDLKGEDDG